MPAAWSGAAGGGAAWRMAAWGPGGQPSACMLRMAGARAPCMALARGSASQCMQAAMHARLARPVDGAKGGVSKKTHPNKRGPPRGRRHSSGPHPRGPPRPPPPAPAPNAPARRAAACGPGRSSRPRLRPRIGGDAGVLPPTHAQACARKLWHASMWRMRAGWGRPRASMHPKARAHQAVRSKSSPSASPTSPPPAPSRSSPCNRSPTSSLSCSSHS